MSIFLFVMIKQYVFATSSSILHAAVPPNKKTAHKRGFGGEHIFDVWDSLSRELRARSGSALTAHWAVIHYRPVRIPFSLPNKKTAHKRGFGGEKGIRTLETG